MGCIKTIFKDVKATWSLIVGLGVTSKYFFKPQVTVHYPRQEVTNLDTYRGHIELVPKPKNPNKPKCIACMMCATSCPSSCIKVLKAKAPKPTEEEKKQMAEAEAKGEKVKKPKAPKEPAKFILDYSLCSLCGTCADVCPVGSIRFTNVAYMAVTDRKELTMDLLARLENQALENNKSDG